MRRVLVDYTRQRNTEKRGGKAQVELRFFGGLTIAETAESLGVSAATVVRQWRRARAWLLRDLRQGD